MSKHAQHPHQMYMLQHYILVSNWGIKGSASFDVTLNSLPNSSIVSEVGVTAGVAAMRKHEENDGKCTERGWICVPLAVESYGEWGVEVCSFLASLKGIITNTPKSKVLG